MKKIKLNNGVEMPIWFLTCDGGIAVIPKSVKKERMEENYSIWDFELTAADMDAIAKLETGKSSFFNQRDPETAEWLTKEKFH